MKRLMIGAMGLAVAITAVRCGGSNNNNPTGPSTTGPIVFSATLSPANEVPPITSNEANARGTATVTMNVPRDASGNPNGAGTLSFAVQMSGFPAGTPIVAGHIHTGAAGANGGVLISTGLSGAAPLLLTDGTTNTSFNNVPVPADQALAIYTNPAGYYVNFHSQQHPGGVIRGQMVRMQ
jgi:CHRD domain-containing protein